MADMAASDGNACCPIDEELSGCMQLGGASTGEDPCGMTCDFWCSDNWQRLTDDSGCEFWAYDIRSPAGGEDEYCLAVDPNGDATSGD
jgi:hypothetical protein